MGHLSALTLPSREVDVPGSDFKLTLRGLSASDVAILTQKHMPAMVVAFNAVQQKMADGMDASEIESIVALVMQTAPELVAHMILLANDDPDPEAGIVAASRLPALPQIAALVAVFELTLHSEAEVKKMIEMLTGVMGSIQDFIQGLRMPSLPLGTGESADT